MKIYRCEIEAFKSFTGKKYVVSPARFYKIDELMSALGLASPPYETIPEESQFWFTELGYQEVGKKLVFGEQEAVEFLSLHIEQNEGGTKTRFGLHDQARLVWSERTLSDEEVVYQDRHQVAILVK